MSYMSNIFLLEGANSKGETSTLLCIYIFAAVLFQLHFKLSGIFLLIN